MNFSLHYLAEWQAAVSLFRAFIHRANLFAYLGKLTAYTPENGFQGAKAALPMLCFNSSLPLLFEKKNYENGLLLKHGYVYCQLLTNAQLRA